MQKHKRTLLLKEYSQEVNKLREMKDQLESFENMELVSREKICKWWKVIRSQRDYIERIRTEMDREEKK